MSSDLDVDPDLYGDEAGIGNVIHVTRMAEQEALRYVALPEVVKDAPVIVYRSGQKLEAIDLSKWRDEERPLRKTGSTEHSEIDSFIEMCRRHAGIYQLETGPNGMETPQVAGFGGEIWLSHPLPSTVVRNHLKVRAVFNPHTAERTGFGDHSAIYEPSWSREYAAWVKLHAYTEQTAFATMLERLIHTIIEPDYAELLKAIEFFRFNSERKLEKKINRVNNTVEFTFAETERDDDGQTSIRVPSTIKIRLIPFNDSEAMSQSDPVMVEQFAEVIDAQLRYHVQDGKVTFAIDFINGHDQIYDNHEAYLRERLGQAFPGTPIFS